MNTKKYFKNRTYIFFRPLIYIISFFKYVFRGDKSNYQPINNKPINVFNDSTIKILRRQDSHREYIKHPTHNRSYIISTVNVVSNISLRVIRNKYA